MAPRQEGFNVSLPNHRVRMTRDSLDGLPHWTLPEGFSIRWYETGDIQAWLRIHVVADLFNEFEPGFHQEEFGEDEEILAKRQAFLCDSSDRQIGTASAWFDESYHGKRYGRLHWVAIEPRYQGRGLSKALTSAVCRRLVELGHDRAYLTTSTARIPAINLYLQFGFEPEIRNQEDERAWYEIRDRRRQ